MDISYYSVHPKFLYTKCLFRVDFTNRKVMSGYLPLLEGGFPVLEYV